MYDPYSFSSFSGALKAQENYYEMMLDKSKSSPGKELTKQSVSKLVADIVHDISKKVLDHSDDSDSDDFDDFDDINPHKAIKIAQKKYEKKNKQMNKMYKKIKKLKKKLKIRQFSP